jgi:hypothetical protein
MLFVGIVLTAASVGIALASLWTTRSANTRRTLSELLGHMEATRLDLLMWRMDQMTRPDEPLDSISPKDVDELQRHPDPDKRALVKQALSTDWGSLTAHMHDVYHYALRVHAWLTPDKNLLTSIKTSGIGVGTKIRLLNETFGYRLLVMFLDHRIVACRLHNPRTPAGYYPTHYGLFDPRYSELVKLLFDDLVYGPSMGANLWVLPKKHEAVSRFLLTVEPIETLSQDDNS